MSDTDRTAKMRKFYEIYPFPGYRPLDRDGLIFMRHFAESVDRMHGGGEKGLRVLDAGCGTGNTSLSLAHHFPGIEVLGVDQSRTSLSRAKTSAAGRALPNLAYRRWNLSNPFPPAERFNIILCLGVLHHTADMKRVLANLRRSLTNDGELYLWIYGKHGRYRHSLNVRLLSLFLATEPAPANPVDFTRDFIRNIGDGSMISDLLGTQPAGPMQKRAFDDPVWIADQFLNPVENLLEMEDLLTLASSAGFSIERLLDFDGTGEAFPDPLRERFNQLTHSRQLIALDLLLKPERYFAILRKSRGRN